MNVRKIAETATSITLGWDAVPGADGYRFYSAGVLRSRTFDPSRRSVKFSKGQAPYKIEAVKLSVLDSGEYPAPKPPDPPPTPTRKFLAPQTYNKGSRGQDAQYCTTGLPRDPNGIPYEPSAPGITYNDGLCNGGRTGDPVPGLKPADEMDSRGPCDPYTHNDVSFPPWPEQSYAW